MLNISQYKFTFILIFLLGCYSQPKIERLGSDKGIDTLKAGINVGNYPGPQIEDLGPLILDKPALYAPINEFDSEEFTFPEVTEYDSLAVNKPVSPSVVDGYRVQVFSGHDQLKAKQVENQFKNFGWNTYIMYEAPQYKVRIGDFSNRSEAVAVCDSLRRNGFPEAWIVRSMINKP